MGASSGKNSSDKKEADNNSVPAKNLLISVKSKFILKIIFKLLDTNKKLGIITYNKKLKNKFELIYLLIKKQVEKYL